MNVMIAAALLAVTPDVDFTAAAGPPQEAAASDTQLLGFTAEWCTNCEPAETVLAAATAADPSLNVRMLDYDRDRQLFDALWDKRYAPSAPSFILLKGGKVAKCWAGAPPSIASVAKMMRAPARAVDMCSCLDGQCTCTPSSNCGCMPQAAVVQSAPVVVTRPTRYYVPQRVVQYTHSYGRGSCATCR